MDNTPKLPKLPQGEGSFTWIESKEVVQYRKIVNGKRLAVYGKDVKEAMKKMKAKEKQAVTDIKKEKNITFGDAIKKWFFTRKKNTLKSRSFDREENTINNQILRYTISHIQLSVITGNDIQEHLDFLINKSYSYSTIKKTYEVMKQFFNYTYVRNPSENPMLTVTKPTQASMDYRPKEIEILDDDDIKLFVAEATRLYSNGKPVYKYGYGMVALLYTGLRMSEVRALHWLNFTFSEKESYVKITENLSKVVDREKSTENKKVYKNITTIPKTAKSQRTILLNNIAKENFLKLREIQEHNLDTDFVFATKTGQIISERNLRRVLNNIQEKAGTKVQNSGLHMLRHTFCSLLCRNHIDKKVIAEILGQESTEMIDKVYQHVTEQEKIQAIKGIDTL